MGKGEGKGIELYPEGKGKVAWIPQAGCKLMTSLHFILHSGVGSSTEYKVVMLTGDRNLRVKAHASDQPVKDIPNFMKLLSK